MSKHRDISIASATEAELADVERVLARTIFVVPSINGGKLLRQMLPTLKIPSQCIIVLDQGSSDDTQTVCDEFGVELMQLNEPHTYTQCCNIAIKEAQKRNCEYFFLSNNDIMFITDVARELIYECINDSSLGALTCSQVNTSCKDEPGVLSNRVYWNLSTDTLFYHDLAVPSEDIYRLESDFCEMTCTLIRTEAAAKVGGFDDKFGFYYEDADFCFRLREAGYTTAYLPRSQIKHFQGSTFSQGRAEARLKYIENSKKVFIEKNMGYGLRYIDHKSGENSSWNIINIYLYAYLKRFGMVDVDRTELVYSHPTIEHPICLYTVWETTELPQPWLKNRDTYQVTYLPSQWNMDVFRNAGYQRLHYVPLGVETDVFQPWGKFERFYDGPTFLWFARFQYRKGYDVLLKAWDDFYRQHPEARLIIMGHGIFAEEKEKRAGARQSRQFLIYDDHERGISYQETLSPLGDKDLAAYYRSVDFVVLTSRSEGFGFSVVEAMACGATPVFSNYGATRDMVYEGAITFDAPEVPADYSDKDFDDVGNWWEPDPLEISRALARAVSLSPEERKTHLRRGLNIVRSQFTWRHTCFAILRDLKTWQTQKNLSVDSLTSDEAAQDISSAEFLASAPANAAFLEGVLPSRIDIGLAFCDFDRQYYLKHNPDIKRNGIDPLSHFLMMGWAERGRNPSASFDTKQYLASNALVRNILAGLHGFQSIYSRKRVLRALANYQRDMLVLYAARDEVEAKAFIDIVYKIALNRPPTEDELSKQAPLLAAGPKARQTFVRSVFSSREKRRKNPFFPTAYLPFVDVSRAHADSKPRPSLARSVILTLADRI